MSSFKDTRDREWELAFNHGTAQALMTNAGINVYAMPQQKFDGLKAILFDPFKMLDMAWWCAQGSAKKHNATREDFDGSIDGPVQDAIGEAILKGVPDFFSDQPTREGLRKGIDRMLAAKPATQRLVNARVEKNLASFDPEKAVQEALDKAENQSPEISNDKSGNGPEPAESTPTPTSSGNYV